MNGTDQEINTRVANNEEGFIPNHKNNKNKKVGKYIATVITE